MMYLALIALLAIFSPVVSQEDAGTCDPSTWSAGHDFKNMQYSHINATSPGDCCSKCAKYSDSTIGQCKFWTFDGVGTCWVKSNNKGYRTGSKKITCGSVANVPPPTPPPPKPKPAPPAPLPPVVPPTPGPWDGKPVQVYIMMGQSNMLGMGAIMGSQTNSLEQAVFNESKFPWLKNGSTWSTYPNMRNVAVMGNGNGTFQTAKLQHNDWLTADCSDRNSKKTIGPELGIANFGGTCTPASCSQDNVMLLKSCIGNRALGWDLLPPGTPRHDFTDSKGQTWTYAGYKDSPMKWLKSAPKPPPQGWYAGCQWDGDTGNAQYIVENLPHFFPNATKYEIAGFFWWQGDKDSRDAGLSAAYEDNLVHFIKTLRETFKAPNAPFVTASLGQTKYTNTSESGVSGDAEILQAMLNVGCNGETQGAPTQCKYPEFKDNVAAVYTHPLLNTPGSSGAHYGHDSITYMNVGVAMGAEMAKMKNKMTSA